MDFTRRKFLSLSPAAQHKKASELLKSLFLQETRALSTYRNMEEWLSLPAIDFTLYEEVSSRFHFHLHLAGISQKEHTLLYIRHQDKESAIPFLPIVIYLCSLRSAFNVGSIFRTTEAFRLGTLVLAKNTPGPENPKVQKASMGTSHQVPCYLETDETKLPRPWIALETATPSTPFRGFLFPKTFTLIIGNEEFGIPKELLSQCDVILEIPLVGSKNSLNVASAFSIVAAEISAQHH